MGSASSCFEGIAALLNSFRSKRMLPAPSYVQKGSCLARSHRSGSASRLLETYSISPELLGEGTFGTVVKTTSVKTGSVRALKRIDKRAVEEDFLLALANEIAIHKVCDHPNIVRLYETFEDSDYIHIAMETCEGGEVLELLDAQGRLSEEDAGLVMQQVLQAVLYLHGVKQVAHRDLKPDNLLLKSRRAPLAENSVKVIDFGLATSFTPGKRSLSMVCGTPAYMAPETTSGSYDEKCDIWSCGIMLYELLSGDVPFQGTSSQTLMRAAASLPLDFDGAPWGNVSDLAKELLGGMCGKDPAGRASAEDALRSAWFQKLEPARRRSPSISSDSSEMAENIRSFSQLDEFQRRALRLAAFRMDDPQVAAQRTAFQLLDKNGDGRITLQELGDGCPEIGLSAAEARELFERLDVEGGGLEYSEFISAAVNKDSLPHEACWEAFRFCDQDGSGSISSQEIRELIGGGGLRRTFKRSPCSGGVSPGSPGMDFNAFATMLRGGRAEGA